jgi:nicotinamidase-related amidase
MRYRHRHFGPPHLHGQTLSQAQVACGEELKEIYQGPALIVIDMQKGFDEATWGARNNPQAETCVARLMHAWRDAAATVLHVHHCSVSPIGSFRPGSRGIEPKPQATPQAGEVVYHKRVNSAFIGTALEADLRQRGINTLVIVGLTTNHCVSTSVRMAGNLGFQTYVVSDATATFARAGADGRLRSAEEVHNAALGDLQGEFAEVVTTEMVVESMTQGFQGFIAPQTQPANRRVHEPPF